MSLFDPSNSPDKKQTFWMLIFLLFLLPITNSFFVNINKLVKSVIANKEYKKMLVDLDYDNKKLKNKVRYYKTSHGIKTLIKERLNKVEDGELLIKFDEPKNMEKQD
jgi:hypothetical protein